MHSGASNARAKKEITLARIKTTIIIDTPFLLLFYAQRIFAS
jgi:hypothetical protein